MPMYFFDLKWILLTLLMPPLLEASPGDSSGPKFCQIKENIEDYFLAVRANTGKNKQTSEAFLMALQPGDIVPCDKKGQGSWQKSTVNSLKGPVNYTDAKQITKYERTTTEIQYSISDTYIDKINLKNLPEYTADTAENTVIRISNRAGSTFLTTKIPNVEGADKTVGWPLAGYSTFKVLSAQIAETLDPEDYKKKFKLFYQVVSTILHL